MKKSEFKKIIKESIREVLVEEGLLSSAVKEALQPTLLAALQENSATASHTRDLAEEEERAHLETQRIKERVEKQTSKLQEAREKMMEAIGAGSYKASYNLEGIFENVSPLTSAGKPGGAASPTAPLGDVDPSDPGVDISAFMNKRKMWEQIVK